MNFQCYLYDGKFEKKEFSDLQPIVENLTRNYSHLANTPINVLIHLLSTFGKALIKTLINEEGIYYLATWLRASNIERYLTLNIGNKYYLDKFLKWNDEVYLRAQPRGIVSHWIAGNIPTLALFSLVQSLLCKNLNILRVPESSLSTVLNLLQKMNEIEVVHDSTIYKGKELLKTISIIYFPSSAEYENKQLSMISDCRVIWGGKEAVNAISALPHKEHCESVVFGPKYSFAVIDEDSVSSNLFKKFVLDIVTFEQNACSSPHVLFCERKRKGDKSVAKRIGAQLAKAFADFNLFQPPGNITNIINTRGIYFLDPDRYIYCSSDLNWTILMDDNLQLEEPIGWRTIYVKGVDSIFDVIPLITKKIQTVGIAIKNKEKKFEFCEKATFQGGSRCVNIGSMNDYDTPWDGILFMNRLVRWTTMQTKEEE